MVGTDGILISEHNEIAIDQRGAKSRTIRRTQKRIRVLDVRVRRRSSKYDKKYGFEVPAL